MKKYNVASFFDGCACGLQALKQASVPIENYSTWEIDKYAIQIAKKNHPEIKHMGDVTKYKKADLPKIDILIGGSPCQGFSFAGKQLNFEDPRSKLFFVFADAVKTLKPKYFFLENVKMKKEYQDAISRILGVEPLEINSALVSAQNRKRLYWTNIPNIKQPEDKHIYLKDIVHENTFVDREKSLCLLAGYDGKFTPKRYFDKSIHQAVFDIIKEYIVPFDKSLKILDKEVQKGKIGYFRKDSQANRVYLIHDKAVTLCGDAGGGAAKRGQYLFGCITPDRIEKRQNGQRFNDGKKFYTLTAQDKHGILIEGYIRKLTPIECERLQTLPDKYTEGVSKTQRYKMLGNGWTVSVIEHCFNNIGQEPIKNNYIEQINLL